MTGATSAQMQADGLTQIRRHGGYMRDEGRQRPGRDAALGRQPERQPARAESRLLAAGADPNKGLLLGETPVMSASRTGSAEVVKALLARGADPNVKVPCGQTALMWAVAEHHAEVVAALLQGGADVHARSDEWTNMMAQPPQSHPEHQRWFEHGGNSALMFAARVGDLESARLLVGAGANVNDTNAWGVSVLTMAVYSNFGTRTSGIWASGPKAARCSSWAGRSASRGASRTAS